jgi:hypothetical protein
MKRTFTLLALVALTLSVLAQSPDLMSYQAVLRDAQDHLLQNQAVAVQISILQGAPNGTAVYTEVHSLNTNDNGLISLMIGDGVTSDDFSTIDWGAGPYYIKTETDPAGGTNYTITSTTQLVSVPYAKYAGEAGNGFSGDYGDLADAPWVIDGSNISFQGGNVGIGTTATSRIVTINSGSGLNYLTFQNNGTGTLGSDGFMVGNETDLDGFVWNWENAPIYFGTSNSYRMTLDGAGHLGIGTQNPVARLDVNGSTKLGVDGITFNGLQEITGTTAATGHFSSISLPTGYTMDNVRVLSAEINYGAYAWAGAGSNYKTPGTTLYNVSTFLSGSTLYIYYPDDASYHSQAYRVLIMLVD